MTEGRCLRCAAPGRGRPRRARDGRRGSSGLGRDRDRRVREVVLSREGPLAPELEVACDIEEPCIPEDAPEVVTVLVEDHPGSAPHHGVVFPQEDFAAPELVEPLLALILAPDVVPVELPERGDGLVDDLAVERGVLLHARRYAPLNSIPTGEATSVP